MPDLSPWGVVLVGLIGQTLLLGKWAGGISTSVASMLTDFRAFQQEVRTDVSELKEGLAELKGRFDTFERRRDR